MTTTPPTKVESYKPPSTVHFVYSRAQSLKNGVFSGNDVDGTCVNRGCVPSKALLAAFGRVRDVKDAAHLQSMDAYVEGEEDDGGVVKLDREGIAKHAQEFANRAKENWEGSLVGLGGIVVGINTQRQKAWIRMRTRSHTRGLGAGISERDAIPPPPPPRTRLDNIAEVGGEPASSEDGDTVCGRTSAVMTFVVATGG